MDSTAGVGQSGVRSEGSLGEKRLSENGEFEVRSVKKVKSGGEFGGHMKKVAEIVLVLATMGKMRAGEVPSSVEIEMMAEARAKLVELSQQFSPKDVFPTHAFASLIEDLGLNNSEKPKLGFQPPKMSIAQKLNVSKQKMENSEKYAPHSAKYTSQTVHSNIGSSAENHPGVRAFSSEKPSPAPSSLGFQPASPLGPVSAANSTPLRYQLPTSEVRLPVSSGLPSSDLGKHASALALPRAERHHFTLNGKSNGISHTSQVQVNSSGDNTKTPTWTVQPQFPSSAKTVSDNNGSTISRPFITQTTSINPLDVHQHVQQGMRFVQSPSQSNSHNEIGKIVQKLLQPKLPEYPIWTPPSRDYMNKALPCQICKLSIIEVNNLLVCDACEKGYHLNCLQFHNPKSVPRAEWQCGKCFSLSNGKPLPPKYGRVTRNSTALQVSSHATAVHLSVDKNVGKIDVKDNLERTTANGSSGIQSAPIGALDESNHFAADAQMGDGRIMQGNGRTSNDGGTGNHFAIGVEMADVKLMQTNGSFSSNGKKVEEHPYGPGANNLIVTSGASSVTPDDLKVERSIEAKLDPECKSRPSAKSETVGQPFDASRTLGHYEDNNQTGLTNSSKIPYKQYPETNIKVTELGKSRGQDFLEHKTSDDAKEVNHGVSVVNPVETTGTCIGPKEHGGSLSDSLHDVDWIGDILQVVDGKTYYQSYLMSGVLYKVQDHALFRSDNNILTPFKLQGMWEDSKTRSKWVVASRCYFPADLPEGVGRPCSPEINEVYESNHDTILSAGLIEGLCEVLPPRRFFDETERRTHLGMKGRDSLHPLFICKWFYDERKGLFRAVTS